MNTGQYISAAGHGGLILWALVGGLFLSPNEPQPAEVAEVSIMSEAEFAALSQPRDSMPNPEVEAPQVQSPDADAPPQTPAEVEATQAQPTPDAPADSAPDATPVPLPPQPRTEVSPQVPDSAEPPRESEAGDVIAALPSERPIPRPAPRVAPVPVPDAPDAPEIAEQSTPAVSDQADSSERAEEAPAAAPEEATTEIVTEAERPAGMSSSPRPRARPANLRPPAPAPTPQPEQAQAPQQAETPAQSAADDAAAAAAADVAAALAGAQADTPAAPVGPPLSSGEREALRVAVNGCWNVDVGSESARVTVTVAMSMNPDGTVQGNSLRLLSSSGGQGRAVDTAFQAARRAILRCQRGGYPLPREKFSHWQDIEMTFNPEQMRVQ